MINKLIDATLCILLSSYGVFELSDSINHTNGIKWELVLCLLAMWILCFLILFRGIKSSGKVQFVET
jgi:cytosine/uracil/thiamine/allantoin permease